MARSGQCTGSGLRSELDFFLLHAALVIRHPIACAYGLSCVKPHTAVCCSLIGQGSHDVVRVLRKKKAFSEEPSIGTSPFIPDPVWCCEDIAHVDTAWQDWSLSNVICVPSRVFVLMLRG
eukprot:6396092-Amphidinium_carterae.1